MALTADEIHRRYDSQLRPRMRALDAIRARAVRYGLGAVLGFFAALLLGAMVASADVPVGFAALAIGAGMVGAGYLALRWSDAADEHKAAFKKQIVAEIVSWVCPGAEFHAEGLSELSESFRRTGIFRDQGVRVGIDDCVRGALGRTAFDFADVAAEHVTRTQDDEGKESESRRPVFQGLFLRFDFNKQIRGETHVDPEKADAWRLGPRDRLQRVALENPDFEALFAVTASDPVEARYILTPALMENLVRARTEIGRPVHLAFAGSFVSLAVEEGRPLFEAGLTRPVSFEEIAEMAAFFGLAERLVEQLDLNTRIWTKR